MKKLLLAASILASIALVGCGPPEVPPVTEIETNESAFVIPLEGDSKGGQAKFESVDFLQDQKVAAKRITIPIKKRHIGRSWQYWKYEWLPLVRVVTVDRTPITREWTSDSGSTKTKAIEVESKDSVGFYVGTNITAYIDEQDTATFLYYYRNQPLYKVIDSNVRGVIQTKLSEQFANYTVNEAIKDKNAITQSVREDVIDHFKEYGITITSFGIAEGLTFIDDEIQTAINKTYTAEKHIEQAEFERKTQAVLNQKNLEVAQNEREMAEEFAKAAEARTKQVSVDIMKMKAEALLNFSNKWDGSSVPKFITLGSGSTSSPEFLMNIGQ